MVEVASGLSCYLCLNILFLFCAYKVLSGTSLCGVFPVAEMVVSECLG